MKRISPERNAPTAKLAFHSSEFLEFFRLPRPTFAGKRQLKILLRYHCYTTLSKN